MRSRIIFENVHPSVDGGRWPAKATVSEPLRVTADVLRDGHEPIRVVLRWQAPGEAPPVEVEMVAIGNDAWEATIVPEVIGRHAFTIAGWADPFDYWHLRAALFTDETPLPEVEVELAEAAAMVKDRAARAVGAARRLLDDTLSRLVSLPAGPEALAVALDPAVHEAMGALHEPHLEDRREPALEVVVDRARARVGAWYEMFPRSEGSLRAAESRLPALADMGFDVVYLPPIHPIGVTLRKGKGNTLVAGPDDIGSPWAIGNQHGGHTMVEPTLGTIDDFDHFVEAAANCGLEVALDYAIQFSPDHPWVTEHPEWFRRRIDGSVRYAENPPKKYQDIYAPEWDGPDAGAMWTALKDIVTFWIDHRVRIFRVDNPHTKPFLFWEWLIREVHRDHPDVVFLSEAFTRPKIMHLLAKVGFSQSYTYFTWRNSKEELTDYLTELATDGSAAYMRTNFFANTPDILHEYLQHGGPGAFAVRLILAATLSPSYGIYSGFELYENIPMRRGSEEYFMSEKYEIRRRRWDQPNNLIPLITRINWIRNHVRVFDRIDNIRFCPIDNEAMLSYLKHDGGEAVLAVVNLDPLHWREATVEVPWWDIPGVDPAGYRVRDLLTDEVYRWHGERNYVRLHPDVQPAHLLMFER